MSKVRQIEEIGLDEQGYLFVRPSAASANEFSYIWRDASGIRWNAQLLAFFAAEPGRWAVSDLYKQIVAAAYREYGVQLRATPSTVWSRIPADQRTSIEAFDVNTAAD